MQQRRELDQAAAAEVALGCGLAFISGSDSALLWVSLPESQRALAYRRYEGRMQAAAQTSEALSSGVTTLVGGGTGPATGTSATTCTPGP